MLRLLLWRRVVLQIDEVRGRVISKLFLLVGKRNLLIFEKLSLLFMLVLGKQLLSILLNNFFSVSIVLQSLHEVLRLLGVDTREVADVLNELFEEFCLQGEGLLRNEGTGTKNNFLGKLRVSGQKSPVDEAAIPEIRVFAFLGDVLEEILEDFLPIFRFVQIELHAGNQDLLLDHIRLILEVLNEVGHELVSIIDDLDVLSNNPDNRSLGLWVVEVVEVLADVSEEALVLVGVLAEDISNDDDCLLHDVGDLGLECLP